jgi:hypothetical protein
MCCGPRTPTHSPWRRRRLPRVRRAAEAAALAVMRVSPPCWRDSGWDPAALALADHAARAVPELCGHVVADHDAAGALPAGTGLALLAAAATHRTPPAPPSPALWRQLCTLAAQLAPSRAALVPLAVTLAAAPARPATLAALLTVCDQLLLDRSAEPGTDPAAAARCGVGAGALLALPAWAGSATVDLLVGTTDDDAAWPAAWAPWPARVADTGLAQVWAAVWPASVASLLAREHAAQPRLVPLGASGHDLPPPSPPALVVDIVRRLLMLAIPPPGAAAATAATAVAAAAAAALAQTDPRLVHAADHSAWHVVVAAMSLPM